MAANKVDFHSWIARILIAVVVVWNLQCALAFLLNPGAFAPGFELSGIPGDAAVRGMAVLFVMWIIPYLVALWNPRRNRVSLWEALAMQGIGVIGESIILLTLSPGHAVLHASLLRFIAFDAAGVVVLAGAIFLARK
jgi:hypothetical protein